MLTMLPLHEVPVTPWPEETNDNHNGYAPFRRPYAACSLQTLVLCHIVNHVHSLQSHENSAMQYIFI